MPCAYGPTTLVLPVARVVDGRDVDLQMGFPEPRLPSLRFVRQVHPEKLPIKVPDGEEDGNLKREKYARDLAQDKQGTTLAVWL